MDDATVGVVIPFYNDSGTVCRAIRSVLDQTRPAARIVIVDDASSVDESSALAALVDDLDSPLIHVVTLDQNKGPSAARNRGIDACSECIWVALLDADDSWHPDKLMQQVSALSRHSNLAILGTKRAFGETWTKNITSQSLTLVRSRQQIFRNRFATSSMIIRRNIDPHFREDMRYSEDNELWCRVLLTGHRGAVLNQPLYRAYKESLSPEGASGRYWQMYRGQLKAYRSLHSEGLIALSTLTLCITWSSIRMGVRLGRLGLRRVTARGIRVGALSRLDRGAA